MNTGQRIEQLKQFIQSVYHVFRNFPDVLMNLIDAISSNTTAQSVVELSLNPAPRRGYSALFKGIGHFHKYPNQQQKKEREKDDLRLPLKKKPPKDCIEKRPLRHKRLPRNQKRLLRHKRLPRGQKQAALTPQKAATRPEAAPTPQKAATQPEASRKQVEVSAQMTATLGARTKCDYATKNAGLGATTRNAGLDETTRADAHRQQSQKQVSEESQPDYTYTPSEQLSKKQAPAHLSQKQAPNQVGCANDAPKERQSSLKEPQIDAKEPQIAAKEPQIASP